MGAEVIDSPVVVQALIVAGITACVTTLATGYVSGRIMDVKLQDLRDRIIRIEKYLNGLLKIHETK